MRIQYNSPVILTFTLLSATVLVASTATGGTLMSLFTVYPTMDLLNPIDYFRLFSHVLGHGDWGHLLGNFTFILLIGPMLEEKYGSKNLLIMMLITALVTGLLNVFLFTTALLGASGIVFMLILLSSVANFQKGKIPLTFILVVILFLGQELLNAFKEDHISQFGHIIGGICGGIFGFSGLKRS